MTTETQAIPVQSRTSATGSAAQVNASHPVGSFLGRLVAAPSTARIAMAIGELATSCDSAAQGRPVAVAVSAVESDERIGQTAVALATLWGRWGRSTVLIDLGSGTQALSGAVTASAPDLGSACEEAVARKPMTTISRLHASVPQTGVIAAGKADVLGLISTGRLAGLIEVLKMNHDRVVLAVPKLATGFPLLSLGTCCDRLVLALERGVTRGGPVREIAEQAIWAGLRPLDVIWFE
ncbi:MAG: hypothetical protein IT430_14515 [Phycisphaerales bacterium]|nr:hypothetical protein [Phycisphaerales bacterium]